MRFSPIPLIVCSFVSSAFAGGKNTTLGDLAQHAVQRSQLTLPGSSPFHLKATIIESTNPASDFRGEIDEYWVSPDKWRRTISTPAFSQTLIVNGGKTFEQDKGDYFPWWLNDLVTAVFDPLPMIEQLKKVNLPIEQPSASEHSTVCPRFQIKVGRSPAENSAFLVYCFEGSHGLLESVVTPGYEASFKDYRSFKGKSVPRVIATDPEPGTTIELRVKELRDLQASDEAMFEVERSTPVGDRLKSVPVTEAEIRELSLLTPDILWPSVRSGKTAGVLSMYISLDRNGRVREAWPLNSDNAGLEDPARAQVMQWQFKPAIIDGVPVQVETIITLAFTTKIGDPIPILSNEEARKLASKIVEPIFPSGSAPKGSEVKIQIGVSLDGTVNGAGNPYHVPPGAFFAASMAVKRWHFQPYIRDGKPDLFGADVVFRVP